MTPYAMRASRKQRHTVGRGAAEDADRGAMAGGGAPSRGRGASAAASAATAKPPSEMRQDLETTGSRKRKRGQNSPDIEDGVEEPNGSDDSISHQQYPELDSVEMAKLREVIDKEFSLEILLKNQERKTIEAERAKVEISLKQLEQCHAAGDSTHHETPNRYHTYYNQYVEYPPRLPQRNGSIPPQAPAPSSSSRPQRSAAVKAASRNHSAGNICLAKNDEGKVVRVTCPDCHRYDFSNVQGFINHCRIAHKIEYASHDDAVRHCGVEIDLSEFGAEDSPARQPPIAPPPTRPGIQSILNTSSTLSGKLPETAASYKRKLSTTSFDDDVPSLHSGVGNGGGANTDLTTAFSEFVASPVTTRARAQSFNSMFTNGDFSTATNLMAGFNNNQQSFNQPIIHNSRRNSLPGPSKMNTMSKRNGGSRVSSRRTTSNGMPSPAETDTTPTLKHLNMFAQSSSLEYDIDGFVEEMRREKHNNMLLAEDSMSVSDSEVEEKADTKKPNAGVRRPTGAGRTPANWVPPTPGLVEVPATRLRNRQQKEKEQLANAAKVDSSKTLIDPPSETTPKPGPQSVAASEDDMLDITTSEDPIPSRIRGSPIRKKQSTTTSTAHPRSTSTSTSKPLKKSPMEEQAFLSTLPLRIKNRRRRTSTNTSSKTDVPAVTDIALVNDEQDRDSDETSSDEEPGTRRASNGAVVEGAMTPTSHTVTTGFVGLSCGKDAPNVHFVSPAKEIPDIFSRPDLVDGSRYYVKRRIKIGNTSKFIPEAKRSPKMAKYTHKWMIYFVSPPYSAPISTFLSSVTIFLDESFPLPRIIELRVPPFRWVSYGWGEFNLNIRLVFCDPAKNKPMDVVHTLKLDPGKSGREVTGYEGYFDVELDRSSQFLPGEQGVEYDEVPKMAEVERAAADHGKTAGSMGKGKAKEEREEKEEVVDADTIRVAEIRDMITISPRIPARGKNIVGVEKRPILPKNGSFSDESVAEKVSDMDDTEVRQIVDSLEPYTTQLEDAVKKYPLIGEAIKLPYSVAPSNQVFLSWNMGRQKSVEWHRARLIQADVQSSLSPEVSSAAPDLTVKSVLVWCRQTGRGPPVASPGHEDAEQQLHYCRCCGMIQDTPPPKGQKRSKSSWGVDAYCRCGQDVTEQLALMKTSSSAQEMINRYRPLQQKSESSYAGESLNSREIRSLLSHTDVNLMRWVWSTVLQLDLPGTQPSEDDEASNDTLAVSAIITHATRSFLDRLVHLASQHSSPPDPEDEDEVIVVGAPSKPTDRRQPHHNLNPTTAPLVVTPIHILRAIRSAREFDFLTNAGMATGSSQQQGADEEV